MRFTCVYFHSLSMSMLQSLQQLGARLKRMTAQQPLQLGSLTWEKGLGPTPPVRAVWLDSRVLTIVVYIFLDAFVFNVLCTPVSVVSHAFLPCPFSIV